MKHFIFVFLFILQQSCRQVGTDEFSTFMVKELELNGVVSFNDLKANILAPKQCLSCHNDFNSEEGLSFYLKAGDPEASILYNVLVNGTMPKNAPRLSLNNITYVRRYIEQLSQSPLPPGSGNIGGKITFNEFKRDFLVPGKCLTCHAEFATESGVNEHIVAGDPEASLFYTIVESGQMPKNNPPLTIEKINYLKNYILALSSAPSTPLPLPLPADGFITFAMLKSNFLATNKCLNCHKSFNDEERFNKKAEKAYKLVVKGKMPKNSAPLSQDKINYLKAYLISNNHDDDDDDD